MEDDPPTTNPEPVSRSAKQLADVASGWNDGKPEQGIFDPAAHGCGQTLQVALSRPR